MAVANLVNEIRKRILSSVGRGDYDAAAALLSAYEEAGGSNAGSLFLRATILAHQSEATTEDRDKLAAAHAEAIDLFWKSVHEAIHEPGTRAMCLVELSRIGYRLSDGSLLTKANLYTENLLLSHGDDLDVQHWYGPILLNIANHLTRMKRFGEAATKYNEAISRLMQWEDLWCMVVRAATQEAWCLSATGHTPEARESIAQAEKMNLGGKYTHDVLLAKGRLALAEKRFDEATTMARAAEEAAISLTVPDWQTVAEAKYTQLLTAIETSEQQIAVLAEEVRTLASVHRLPYMFRWVQDAYRDHIARGESTICGAS